MKLIVNKKDFDEVRDSGIYSSKEVMSLIRMEETDGHYSFNFDPEMAFSAGLMSEDKIRDGFKTLIRNLARVGIIEIEFKDKDLKNLLKEVRKIDRKRRTIVINDDLEFDCNHPKIRNVHLDCWEMKWLDTDAYQYKLRHPVYYERDLKDLKRSGFIIKITEEQIESLKRLAQEEQLLINDVHLFPSIKGYFIFAHGLNSMLLRDIVKRTTVKYNVEEDGLRRARELVFARRIHRWETKEDEEGRDEAQKLFEELDEKGYNAYECSMFTLPAIEQVLRRRGVTIKGIEDIYPDFPKFGFPVRPIEKHEDYKHMPFQDKALQNWIDAGKLGTIALPTGSGKTMIALRAIGELKLKTLIVTPTIEMIFQWKDMLMKWLGIPEEKIGLYYADRKEIRDITVITFQSGHRKIYGEVTPEEEIKADETLVDEIGKLSQSVGLLIMDEGHHSPAPVFQRIMINLKSRYRMSLTATPYREDKNEVLAFLAIGDVVHTEDYATLAEQEIVSPIDFQRIKVELSDEEREMLSIKAKLKVKTRTAYGWSYRAGVKRDEDIELLLDLWRGHPYVLLRQQINGYEVKNTRQVRIRELLGFAEGKFDELLKIVKSHPDSKILIFNEFVDGAKMIANHLQINGHECHVLTGSTRKTRRRKLFQEFRENKSFILATTTVLDEGVNVPDCDVIVIFNASRSKRQMIQRVGRGCRYQPGKIERAYELVAVPSDLDTSGGRGRTRWRRSASGSDDYILDRIREKRTGNGLSYRSTAYGWGTDYVSVLRREMELYEWEKSVYRDITKVINVEKQKEIINGMNSQKF